MKRYLMTLALILLNMATSFFLVVQPYMLLIKIGGGNTLAWVIVGLWAFMFIGNLCSIFDNQMEQWITSILFWVAMIVIFKLHVVSLVAIIMLTGIICMLGKIIED